MSVICGSWILQWRENDKTITLKGISIDNVRKINNLFQDTFFESLDLSYHDSTLFVRCLNTSYKQKVAIVFIYVLESYFCATLNLNKTLSVVSQDSSGGGSFFKLDDNSTLSAVIEFIYYIIADRTDIRTGNFKHKDPISSIDRILIGYKKNGDLLGGLKQAAEYYTLSLISKYIRYFIKSTAFLVEADDLMFFKSGKPKKAFYEFIRFIIADRNKNSIKVFSREPNIISILSENEYLKKMLIPVEKIENLSLQTVIKSKNTEFINLKPNRIYECDTRDFMRKLKRG